MRQIRNIDNQRIRGVAQWWLTMQTMY
jgi:hypothetical protein